MNNDILDDNKKILINGNIPQSDIPTEAPLGSEIDIF